MRQHGATVPHLPDRPPNFNVSYDRRSKSVIDELPFKLFGSDPVCAYTRGRGPSSPFKFQLRATSRSYDGMCYNLGDWSVLQPFLNLLKLNPISS
jgi:hypothetical protein